MTCAGLEPDPPPRELSISLMNMNIVSPSLPPSAYLNYNSRLHGSLVAASKFLDFENDTHIVHCSFVLQSVQIKRNKIFKRNSD